MTLELDTFRAETRAWLADNCPVGARGPGQVPTGSTKIEIEDADVQLWLDRMIERGWTTPTWPTQYGGGGLSNAEAKVLNEELLRIDARAPLAGMGISMIGPTLLEFGTEEQRERHLPKISRAELAWCQGYSEPGAGSDLAALRTRAEDQGDHFVINGQKIWTSGAQNAVWMFALVRTDFDAPKHLGISFMLLPMDQDGVTVRPIQLINGISPFCETFFDNAIAQKADLVGELNQGWTIGKRLLQYERSGQGGLTAGGSRRPRAVGVTVDLDPVDTAKQYLEKSDGRISDRASRDKLTRFQMDSAAFALTQRRAAEENSEGAPGAATSIFKLVGATLTRTRQEMLAEFMGTQGLGWSGTSFSSDETATTRSWLASRAVTIYGGTNEVQSNIIAKRVLGLPD